MEYDFEKIHKSCIKHHVADALSRLNNKETDYFDMEDDVLLMAVHTRARSQQNKSADCTLEKTLNETEEPTLATLEELLCAHITNIYCDKTRCTVGILRLAFNFDKSRLLVTLSPIDGAVQKSGRT